MTECIALLRGINVGRAKRIAMSDLRDLVTGLGHRNVRTLLNSGNVVFEAKGARPGKLAIDIRAAIEEECGVSAHVVVVTAADLRAAIDENPLPVADPPRFLVAFVADPVQLEGAKALVAKSWAPERMAVGSRAAYLWCPNGSIESKVLKAFVRATGETATTRNWATVLKLDSALKSSR